MWKSAYVGVYQLMNWKMHGDTLKLLMLFYTCIYKEIQTFNEIFCLFDCKQKWFYMNFCTCAENKKKLPYGANQI